MGKDDKEDSGFGFKDKAKAEETLRLLEAHDPGYRRLTVRGLLGRAKRTLSLTKAEDKKKNIKEAMEVFETWLAELDAGKEKTEKKSNTKKQNTDDDKETSPDAEMRDITQKAPSDKVPNLGFKDAAAAEGTLRELKGRDPDYQKLAVKGLIGSANRVLAVTRDETKLSNIKEAISILEKFLSDFESQNMSRLNNAYLKLGVVNTAVEMAGDKVTKQQKAFVAAYTSVNGDYKRLRTVHESEGGKTWDIVRNEALAALKEKNADAKLFDDDKKPTEQHLQMLVWAYTPEPTQVKKLIPETNVAREDNDRSSRKRKSSTQDSESDSKKQK